MKILIDTNVLLSAALRDRLSERMRVGIRRDISAFGIGTERRDTSGSSPAKLAFLTLPRLASPV